MKRYRLLEVKNGKPVKMWTQGVPVEREAEKQLPIIFKHVAAMPDVHFGMGSTVGSVIPTKEAIIPAAVGVDIGCGMMAVKTSLMAHDLPDNLKPLRTALEEAIPHGRTGNGRRKRDLGAWDEPPKNVDEKWAQLLPGFKRITDKHPRFLKTNNHQHLGTLGTGNHFVEVCLDLDNAVWVMLHSGSRGVGNAIGSYFIELAKKDMGVHLKNLPDQNLAYLNEGTQHFEDYVEAVEWAQNYAR